MNYTKVVEALKLLEEFFTELSQADVTEVQSDAIKEIVKEEVTDTIEGVIREDGVKAEVPPVVETATNVVDILKSTPEPAPASKPINEMTFAELREHYKKLRLSQQRK